MVVTAGLTACSFGPAEPDAEPATCTVPDARPQAGDAAVIAGCLVLHGERAPIRIDVTRSASLGDLARDFLVSATTLGLGCLSTELCPDDPAPTTSGRTGDGIFVVRVPRSSWLARDASGERGAGGLVVSATSARWGTTASLTLEDDAGADVRLPPLDAWHPDVTWSATGDGVAVSFTGVATDPDRPVRLVVGGIATQVESGSVLPRRRLPAAAGRGLLEVDGAAWHYAAVVPRPDLGPLTGTLPVRGCWVERPSGRRYPAADGACPLADGRWDTGLAGAYGCGRFDFIFCGHRGWSVGLDLGEVRAVDQVVAIGISGRHEHGFEGPEVLSWSHDGTTWHDLADTWDADSAFDSGPVRVSARYLRVRADDVLDLREITAFG